MKPPRSSILLLTAVFITTCQGLTASAQQNNPSEDIHANLIQGKKRSQLIYSGKDRSFTMDILSGQAKPSDVPGFITIDRQMIQATVVPLSRSGDHSMQRSGEHPLRNADPSREKDMLFRYMKEELSFYRKKLKQNYSNPQSEWMTIGGRLFLVWYFDMPKDYKLVSRQLYFSTLFGDQVLDLNAPLFKMDNFNQARELLQKLAGTLKTYSKPLDITKLRPPVADKRR